MKYTYLLIASFSVLFVAADSLARSPMTPSSDPVNSVIPAGLSCEVTAQLPSGKSQKSSANLGDHLMFGPIASGGLQEGGNSTKVPMESAGFVGMIVEDKKNGLVVLNVEAKILRVDFEPIFKEQNTVSRGAIVLSRKLKELSKGTFSVASFDAGAVLVECELK